MNALSIETLVVYPKRAHRWCYVINQGHKHLADDDQIRELIFSLVRVENRAKVVELLRDLQSLLILPSQKEQVFLLKPRDTGIDQRAQLHSAMSIQAAEKQSKLERRNSLNKKPLRSTLRSFFAV